MAKLPQPTTDESEWVTDAPAVRGPGLPTLPPNSQWHYAAHPKRWSVSVSAGRVVPDLIQLAHERGFAGVDQHGNTRPQTLAYEARGWTIIPYDAVPEGQPSYVRRDRVRGGVAYVSAWATLIPGTDRSRIDQAGYDAFLVNLVDSGLIEPPEDYVLERLQDRIEGALAKAQLNADTDPRAARQVERCKAELAILADAMAPEPKKPSTSRKKSGSASE